MVERELAAGEPQNKTWPICCDDCNHEWQSQELTPDSNELLNIFLIIIGLITVLYGIFQQFPALFPMTQPYVENEAVQALAGMLGGMHIILGGFAFIAGIGLFNEQEWAWGMALMVLTFIIANNLLSIIAAFDFTSFGFWLQLISVGFAVLGVPWLLATKSRYF